MSDKVLAGDSAVIDGTIIDILGTGENAQVTVRTSSGAIVRLNAYDLYEVTPKKENSTWLLIKNLGAWLSLVLSETLTSVKKYFV